MDHAFYKKCLEAEVYKNIKLKSLKSLYSRWYNKYINPPTNAVYMFRKKSYLAQKGTLYKIRAKFLASKLAKQYGILASPYAKIDIGLHFVHPTSIVIGSHVIAGKNLSLYQNTTIGGARTGDVNKGNQPTLLDNVILFANSLVLGKITVGNNVQIGANSLLLKSVPDDIVCVGSPAQIVQS